MLDLFPVLERRARQLTAQILINVLLVTFENIPSDVNLFENFLDRSIEQRVRMIEMEFLERNSDVSDA